MAPPTFAAVAFVQHSACENNSSSSIANMTTNGRVTEFIFVGRGWGHGVGMCQVGAYGLAKQGWSTEQILKAYYSGIELTRMY